MLNRIDRYILKNFMLTFLVCILMFTIIAVVIDYTEKVSDFVKHDVSFYEIMIYFRNFIPHIIALLFPIFIFVSVILFTSRMAVRSEFVAILSTGIEFKRMMRPYFVGAGLICFLLLIANHFIIPKTNKQRLDFESKYTSSNRVAENVHATYIKLNDSQYVNFASFRRATNAGYGFNYSKLDGNLLKEKIYAARCSYDSIKNEWILSDVKRRLNNGDKERFEKKAEHRMKLAFDPGELFIERKAREHMSTPEINEYLKKERGKGRQGLSQYELEKHRRTSSPFSAFILSIIGACIAHRKVRGGNGMHLALGLIISAAYIVFMQFSTTFAVKGNLSPLLAVWIPNLVFGIVAIVIYQRAKR